MISLSHTHFMVLYSMTHFTAPVLHINVFCFSQRYYCSVLYDTVCAVQLVNLLSRILPIT